MEILCPACLGRLTTDDGKTARCTLHGGTFQILFNRSAMNLGEQPAPPAPIPPAPAAPSDLDLTIAIPSNAPSAPAAETGALTVAELLAQHPATGMNCVQHPNTPAMLQCQSCGAYMCATCDFAFPDGRHLCPSCATNPRPEITPRRKRAMIWSFGLAGGGSVGMVLCFIAAMAAADSRGGEQIVGMLFMLLVLAPAIAGLAVGCSVIDRQRKNSPALWGAIIWNGLLMGTFLLLLIVGMASG